MSGSCGVNRANVGAVCCTLGGGWACGRFHTSDSPDSSSTADSSSTPDTERRAVLKAWLRYYDHRRLRPAIENKPPRSRSTSLSVPDIWTVFTSGQKSSNAS